MKLWMSKLLSLTTVAETAKTISPLSSSPSKGMMNDCSTLCTAAAFVTALITSMMVTKEWIRVAKARGIVGKDVNKEEEIYVPEGGGVGFVMGTVMGTFAAIALSVFIFKIDSWLVYLLASVTTFLMASFIGFIDDVLGWKKGLSHRAKVLSTVPIAVPLVAVNAGVSVMCLPFFGCVKFGILYPLVIIPIGIVGATNAFNMIAGLNGLEASMASVIYATLGLLSYHHNRMTSAVLSFASLGAALGFLYWNKYPAKVFPGDVFTYAAGSMIAAIAIVGNLEGAALILFIPYFLELFLYLYGKVHGIEKESWGVPKGGCLELPYDKPYSVTHLAMLLLKKVKGCAKERDVVTLLVLVEIVIAAIVLVIYW